MLLIGLECSQLLVQMRNLEPPCTVIISQELYQEVLLQSQFKRSRQIVWLLKQLQNGWLIQDVFANLLSLQVLLLSFKVSTLLLQFQALLQQLFQHLKFLFYNCQL